MVEEHQHLKIDNDKIEAALTSIFDIILNNGFTFIEQDIIANSVWTRITTEKLIQISAVELSSRIKAEMDAQEANVNNTRPHYYQ